MSFSPIDLNTIKVGDPITRDLWLLLKNNLDDHELRINSLATSGGSIFIFNGDVSFVGFNLANSDIFYYKARQDFSINDFRVQLFTKQGITSGNLIIDLQKSTNTNDANFSTILSGVINFNFLSDADYSEKTGVLNPLLNDITTGQVIRVKVTNIPLDFSGKILLSIGAQ